MTTLPMLPQPRATEDERAAALLSASLGKSLTISRSTSGEWILSPSNDISAAKLRAGVDLLDAALAGGPAARIAAALMRLTSATRRPSWMTDDIAETYFETLQEALHDYPVDIVESACRAWRRGPTGEWWPAEKELRRECDKFFASRRELRVRALSLLSALEQEEARQERASHPSAFAGDVHRSFRDGMRKRLKPARFDAYFHPSQIKYSGERVVLVRTMAAQNLFTSEGGDLVKQLKLTVCYAPAEFLGERQPTWEDDTPEERAEIAIKLNRLKAAIAAGADIKQMRKDGWL